MIQTRNRICYHFFYKVFTPKFFWKMHRHFCTTFWTNWGWWFNHQFQPVIILKEKQPGWWKYDRLILGSSHGSSARHCEPLSVGVSHCQPWCQMSRGLWRQNWAPWLEQRRVMQVHLEDQNHNRWIQRHLFLTFLRVTSLKHPIFH